MHNGWLVGALALALVGCDSASRWPVAQTGGLLPDLAPLISETPYLQDQGGRVRLRFSVTIRNVGAGPLQVRGQVRGDRTEAFQEVLDAAGQVAATIPVGSFEYHPTHYHTHVDQVARYELRQGGSDGPVLLQAAKVSYCLQDSVPVGTPGYKRYAQCTPTLQGISAGWGDYYGADIPDQDLDVTDLAPGRYTLAVTADPTRKFQDADRGNDTTTRELELDSRRRYLVMR